MVFLLSFKALGRLFDDVELILYGIGVMVLSCLLMVRKFSEDIIGDDDHDVDAFAAWLTAIVGMYGVGYPIGHTAVIGWFSKAMKSRPQGMLMGLFASAGSVARIVFPIVTGFVATHFSADAVFGVLATLLGTTLAILIVHRQAFREAAQIHHPDKAGGDRARFEECKAAADAILDRTEGTSDEPPRWQRRSKPAEDLSLIHI